MANVKIDDICNLVRLAHVVMKKTNNHVSVELNSECGVVVTVKRGGGDSYDLFEIFDVDPKECSELDCKKYVKSRDYLKVLLRDAILKEVKENG